MSRKAHLLNLMRLRERNELSRVSHSLGQLQNRQKKSRAYCDKLSEFLSEKCAEDHDVDTKHALFCNHSIGHKLAEQLHQTKNQVQHTETQIGQLKNIVRTRQHKVDKLAELSSSAKQKDRLEKDAKEDQKLASTTRKKRV